MKLLDSLRKNSLIYPSVLVLLLITTNTAIVYYNNSVLKKTNADKLRCERVGFLLSQIWDDIVRNVDIANRGFALGKSESLLSPMKEAINKKPALFQELEKITKEQGFTNTTAIDSIDYAVDDFIAVTQKMVSFARADQMDQFMQMLNSDPGKNTWQIYFRNSTIIRQFENDLQSQAIASYENANFRTVVVQTLLFVIALPTLLFMVIRIRKDAQSRRHLFNKLEKNNRDFIFNPGTDISDFNGDQVIENSIRNFKNASTFIREVSGGNFSVKWEGINESNAALNKENLAGELIQMRDRMKAIKKQDDLRNWGSEGLAKFSEVLRKDQDNFEALTYNALVFIVKYMNAQQGGLFLLREDEEGKSYLDLVACYAFSRKKHISKRLEIGQGLVGQVFLEGRTVMMTEIPNGYTHITSGLGESTPNCILLVPFKYNDKTEAVIELAGFKKFEQHELDFMERTGEMIASTLASVKNTEMMKKLLDQFKSQTEQLRAQEEELRQNMEEMEATQESLRRGDKF